MSKRMGLLQTNGRLKSSEEQGLGGPLPENLAAHLVTRRWSWVHFTRLLEITSGYVAI